MKPNWMDTVVVVIEGLCFIVIGVSTALGTSLAQWANSGEWPDRINWVVIVGACAGAGANSLMSFLSGSYTKYQAGRKNGNGNGAPLPPVTIAPSTKP